MKYGFGVDLGGTFVKLAYFDQTGAMLDKWQIPTDTSENGKNILPDIAASLSAYRKAHAIDDRDILGVGIGVPGPVDESGIVNCCVNLGWGVQNVAQALSSLTGLAVCVGNDANLAALGEWGKGSGVGCKNMLMVTLGTGIGGGIVLDGKILYGAHGAAGEIGNIIINRSETQMHTSGGYGCAEQYCSANGIVFLAKRYLENCSTPSQLRELPDFTCKDIFSAAKDGDCAATQILDQFYSLFGQFLANLCGVLNPALIVLGGGVSKAGQTLVDGVRPYFEHYAFHAQRATEIRIAALGNDAGVYGAFALALQHFFK